MAEQTHQYSEQQLIRELESLKKELAEVTYKKDRELDSLKQELDELKYATAAAQAQRGLLEHLVTMARSSGQGQEEVLKTTLQETLDLCNNLTGAEKGSLFLLDPNGVVIESILTRGEATAEQRSRLIGKVLDKGLAGWVLRHRELGLIKDTETDERWMTLPNQPYVARSALAVPILRGGELKGILTLMHSEPNHFGFEAADLMEVTAEQIALVLENARLFTKLENAKQKIEAYSEALNYELEKGRQIQKDFLPSELIQPPNWEIAACFYPARQVAGDFYDAFLLPGNAVGLVIADVCDKGVGAALFMALFRSLIRVFSGQTRLRGLSILAHDEGLGNMIDPQVMSDLDHINALEAVALTNNYIAQNHAEMSMFATLFFGVLNPETGLLSYINGGHEPLYIVSKSGVKGSLKPTGPAVGMMPDMHYKVHQVELEPGDILIGYTDGVTEARAPNGQFFTTKRLLALLEEPACSASELHDRIKTHLFNHMDNAPQFDDITMLAVQRAPLAER